MRRRDPDIREGGEPLTETPCQARARTPQRRGRAHAKALFNAHVDAGNAGAREEAERVVGELRELAGRESAPEEQRRALAEAMRSSGNTGEPSSTDGADASVNEPVER